MALTTEESEDEVAASGHDLRSGTGADGRTILVEGDIPDIVQAVLDAPMATDQGQQPCGVSAFGWQAGDVVGDFDAGVARGNAVTDGDPVALKPADLAHVRPGCLVGSGTAKPAEHARMAAGPEHPQLASPMADLGFSLEDAGDLPALVYEPAWRDRHAVAVAGCGQPWGKTPLRPR